MMPKTRVSPAASRNSSTPYCSPFKAWTAKRLHVMRSPACSRARLSRRARDAMLLHLAFGMVGVLRVRHGNSQGLVRVAVLVAVLDDFKSVEILDRHMVVIEFEFSLHRLV